MTNGGIMLKTAAIFKDRMVLQRGTKVAIFGETNLKRVEVSFLGTSYKANIENGRWIAEIETPLSGRGLTLDISGYNDDGQLVGNETFKDILLGEVWLAGGQSNMELELRNSDDGIRVAKGSCYPDIRFYNVPKHPVVDEELDRLESETSWMDAGNDNCQYMSAVAYYFAVKIHKTLGVPVGIIDCYWGGTSATCWVDNGKLDDITEANDYLNEWNKVCTEKTDEQFDAEQLKFQTEFDAWCQLTDKIKAENPKVEWSKVEEIAGPCPWNPPRGRKSPYRPYGLYETMVKRVASYTVKGFLYYQAEEDADRAAYYSKLNQALIKQWREDFGEHPFYLMQLPMFIGEGEADDKKWAVLRSEQEKVSKSVKDVGIAVICDCGEFNNIHPTDKETPGTRLALQVLDNTYKSEESLHNCTLSEVIWGDKSSGLATNTCEISFENTYGKLCYKESDGIKLTSKEKELIELVDKTDYTDKIYGIEVTDSSGEYYSPKISFTNNKLKLIGREGEQITGIRYGWFNYGVMNLYSKAGLPVMPFIINKQ